MILTLNFKKIQIFYHYYHSINNRKSCRQEEDSQNRGKNIEKINKKMYMYLI